MVHMDNHMHTYNGCDTYGYKCTCRCALCIVNMHIDMHYGVFMGISMWMWMCMCMCAYLYVYKHMYLHTHAYTSCTCTCNGRYTYDIYTCENSAIILRSDKIRICPLLACPTWNNLSVIEDKHKWFLHQFKRGVSVVCQKVAYSII